MDVAPTSNLQRSTLRSHIQFSACCVRGLRRRRGNYWWGGRRIEVRCMVYQDLETGAGFPPTISPGGWDEHEVMPIISFTRYVMDPMVEKKYYPFYHSTLHIAMSDINLRVFPFFSL